MPIFFIRWFNLALDRFTLYPLIELRAWFASTLLPRVNDKGNNSTTRMPVLSGRSTTYALLVRVDSNNG